VHVCVYVCVCVCVCAQHSCTLLHKHSQVRYTHTQTFYHASARTFRHDLRESIGYLDGVDLAKPALLNAAVVAERAVLKGVYLPHFDRRVGAPSAQPVDLGS